MRTTTCRSDSWATLILVDTGAGAVGDDGVGAQPLEHGAVEDHVQPPAAALDVQHIGELVMDGGRAHPGAKLGLRLAGVANVAMAAGFAWLSRK